MKILVFLVGIFLYSSLNSFAFNFETDIPDNCSNMPDKESETVCIMAKYFRTTIPQILAIQMIVEGEIATKICGYRATNNLSSAKSKILATSHLKKVYRTMHDLSVEPVSRSQWCSHIYSILGPSSKNKTPFFE